VSLAVRRAKFNSTSIASLRGVPDWYIPEDVTYAPTVPRPGGPTLHTVYQGEYRADRRLMGTGAMLGWEASNTLLGSEAAGRVDLDWSLSAGALFGRQTTIVADAPESDWFYSAPILQVNQSGGSLPVPTTVTERTIEGTRRSQSTTVPFFGASLGL